MKNNIEFSTILKDCRYGRKLKQIELADKTGLNASAISNFESGSRKPSIGNLIKLADALEVTTDYLLGREVISDSYDLTLKYSKDLIRKDMTLPEGFWYI